MSTITGVARFGIEVSRDVLRFGERVTPWPLSMIPRTMRLPLDAALGLADALSAEPDAVPKVFASRTAAEAARAAAAMREFEKKKAPDSDRTRRKPDAAGAARPTPEGAARSGAEGTDEPRTATIAGARSEGPADAPRYDRQFRARLAPLYVRDAGDGPALLMLHAFPLSSRMWEPQLVALADRFRVVAPDLAGFGLSWVPNDAFSLADQADAIVQTLDDLKIDEVVVVGASMGGYVAFPLLARLGERVRGLVLACSRASADTEEAVDDRHRLAAEIETEGVDVAAEELVPKLLGMSTMRDRPDLVAHVHAMVLENKESGLASALRAMASRPDSMAALGRITCPVLILAGDEDAVIPPNAARAMAGRLHHARVEVLRGGHLVNLEATLDFNRLVGEFARQAFAAERPRLRARSGGA